MKPPATPEFWARQGIAARLLQPLAWGHAAAGAARQALVRPWQAPVPVVCVGNLVAGGAGKTPIVQSLARILAQRGQPAQILSRGYGGSLAGPVAVDSARHSAAEIGDEPLLLARDAPCWVARDRVAGARAALAQGAELLLMDDGFQNPHLAKDLSLLVIDGAYGIGNGRVLPAGPLRESLASGLARADAVVLMGEDEHGLLPRLGAPAVLRAQLVLSDAGMLRGQPLLAFAGIGRPEKFFRSLEAAGARLVARHGFADHHPYAEAELERLLDAALASGAMLATTEKDAMRLPPAWRSRIKIVAARVAWENPTTLGALLDGALRRRAQHG